MKECSIHDVFLKSLEDALVGLAFKGDLTLHSYANLSEVEVEIVCVEDDVDVSILAVHLCRKVTSTDKSS